MNALIAALLLVSAPTDAVDDGTCVDEVPVSSSWAVFHRYEYDNHIWTDDGRVVAVSWAEDTCNVAWPTGWDLFHPGR